jgi:hypothetical protein
MAINHGPAAMVFVITFGNAEYHPGLRIGGQAKVF